MTGTLFADAIACVLASSLGCGGGDSITVDAGAGDAVAGDAGAPPDAYCAIPSDPPRLIFVNRGGGIYTKGSDDAATNISSVLQEDTQVVASPTISDGLWTQVVACIADRFAPFNIRVVDVDPAPTPHREVVFVDQLSDIGYPFNWSAIAPAAACPSSEAPEPLARGIIFAAAAAFGTNAKDICENAVMSLGFTFDLDRTLHAPDVMSYFSSSNKKTFTDQGAPCGDDEQRPCKCDAGPTQNSYQKLLALAGAACQ